MRYDIKDGLIKKHCNNCGEDKPLTEFYKKKGKYGTPCKECSRFSGREHSRRMRKSRNETNRNFYRRIREQKTEWLYSYLDKKSCVDCGESDPILLEFDHVRGFKYKGIAQLVNSLFSLDKLKDEVAKCDVVCANCHRRRTVTRCNGHRYLYFKETA